MSAKKEAAPSEYEKTDALHRELTSEAVAADAAAEIAHEVENNKYSPWTASMFKLYGVLFIAYCCGCLNGYDGRITL